jgi:peptidyl-prolyl cis-trans isomerase B (cyclophilin B)
MAALACALGSATASIAASAGAPPPRSRTFTPEEIDLMNRTRAVIETTYGEIEVEFLADEAPNHVDNFLKLARLGFYDGTVFHYVVSGIFVQGGDPGTRSLDRTKHGSGGPGYRLRAEFNDRTHARGTLSMVRFADEDSAGSQFFITLADVPAFDGFYTVFGEVTRGMEVADLIARQPTDRRYNPLERIEISVRVIEPPAIVDAPPAAEPGAALDEAAPTTSPRSGGEIAEEPLGQPMPGQ